MVFIKSFCGECCFFMDDAPNKAVRYATEKAEDWVTNHEGEGFTNVVISHLATQYIPFGDYAVYVITITIECDPPEEIEEEDDAPSGE